MILARASILLLLMGLLFEAAHLGSLSVSSRRLATLLLTAFVLVAGGDNQLKKLNSRGSIVASVPVGLSPFHPVFDGTNIWVPCFDHDTVTVVRVKDTAGNPLASPFVLKTLIGNGLDVPFSAAFDGQRILVMNLNGNSLSLWKASDLTPLGSVATGVNTRPSGACSDGVNFFVTLSGTNQLLHF